MNAPITSLDELFDVCTGRDVPPKPVGAPTAEHDSAVQGALYALAVGGRVWEERMTPEGNVVRVRKTVLPSFNAVQLWLQSRMPEAWPKDVKVTHDIGKTLEALIRKSMQPAQLPDERVVSQQ